MSIPSDPANILTESGGFRRDLRTSKRRSSRPTCLKQKGMVSTLTPTMLFTTFMMRPELDAVIFNLLSDASSSFGKKISSKAGQQQAAGERRYRSDGRNGSAQLGPNSSAD